ncbi:hypothetical protein T4B_13945 [Trichinella pseudospiralis]|uniref:Uncharacterized protein n=2 Tax=Trichinella pseudospiralis TaxID=6337 RepID=A0A0V1IMR8_TRIPS|nr:hypothetical protein T4E_2074 [Trichinella pseudospiralis]KRY84100.1 hypothetical protein T4D_4286 [Trichinella pseudospiralis]KRZ24057.1 hypothetical protein T4B_13945 [Trichinella pseudospiralis]
MFMGMLDRPDKVASFQCGILLAPSAVQQLLVTVKARTLTSVAVLSVWKQQSKAAFTLT